MSIIVLISTYVYYQWLLRIIIIILISYHVGVKRAAPGESFTRAYEQTAAAAGPPPALSISKINFHTERSSSIARHR